MQTDRTSEIVGDVAIVFHPNGTAVLRGGSDGRHRIAVPVDDRAAVAAALLPPGTVAVGRERAERLLNVARALAFDWDVMPGGDFVADDDPLSALHALQPGDLDPLPGDRP